MTTIEERNQSCAARVQSNLDRELENIRVLLDDFYAGKEDNEELGTLFDYGLSFDYVEPNTFNEQREGYARWQLSWGGPSDEFRFFINPDKSVHRIEYWFLDWFDGASRTLTGTDFDLLAEIWELFGEFLEV